MDTAVESYLEFSHPADSASKRHQHLTMTSNRRQMQLFAAACMKADNCWQQSASALMQSGRECTRVIVQMLGERAAGTCPYSGRIHAGFAAAFAYEPDVCCRL